MVESEAEAAGKIKDLEITNETVVRFNELYKGFRYNGIRIKYGVGNFKRNCTLTNKEAKELLVGLIDHFDYCSDCDPTIRFCDNCDERMGEPLDKGDLD